MQVRERLHLLPAEVRAYMEGPCRRVASLTKLSRVSGRVADWVGWAGGRSSSALTLQQRGSLLTRRARAP